MTNGEKITNDFPYIEIKGQDEVFTTIQMDTKGSGTPIIVYTDWWNAEYKEPTTKNDLGVDCISRQQAIDAFPDLLPNMGYSKKAITEILQKVPLVTPQEPAIDKIRTEIMDTGAYEQETKGRTEFLEGINYCLGIINKYKAESEG